MDFGWFSKKYAGIEQIRCWYKKC